MKKKSIPNPTQIALTQDEQNFLKGTKPEIQEPANVNRKAKPRNISVYDDFWEELNSFIREYPSEGSRSSIITRVVYDYITRRRAELKELHS